MAAVRGADGRFIKGSGAPGWSSSGGSAQGIRVKVTTEQKSMNRALKRLAKYEGKPLQYRAKKAVVEGARMGVRPIKRSGRFVSRSGKLRGSVTVRVGRLRPGEMAVATVGPRAPHKYLITRGHRIVTPGGRDTGRRTAADPWLDDAFKDYGERAQAFVTTQVLALGNSVWTGLGEVTAF